MFTTGPRPVGSRAVRERIDEIDTAMKKEEDKTDSLARFLNYAICNESDDDVSIQIIAYILNLEPYNMAKYKFPSFLNSAVEKRRTRAVRLILDKIETIEKLDASYALHHAASNGYDEILCMLFDKNASLFSLKLMLILCEKAHGTKTLEWAFEKFTPDERKTLLQHICKTGNAIWFDYFLFTNGDFFDIVDEENENSPWNMIIDQDKPADFLQRVQHKDYFFSLLPEDIDRIFYNYGHKDFADVNIKSALLLPQKVTEFVFPDPKTGIYNFKTSGFAVDEILFYSTFICFHEHYFLSTLEYDYGRCALLEKKFNPDYKWYPPADFVLESPWNPGDPTSWPTVREDEDEGSLFIEVNDTRLCNNFIVINKWANNVSVVKIDSEKQIFVNQVLNIPSGVVWYVPCNHDHIIYAYSESGLEEAGKIVYLNMYAGTLLSTWPEPRKTIIPLIDDAVKFSMSSTIECMVFQSNLKIGQILSSWLIQKRIIGENKRYADVPDAKKVFVPEGKKVPQKRPRLPPSPFGYSPEKTENNIRKKKKEELSQKMEVPFTPRPLRKLPRGNSPKAATAPGRLEKTRTSAALKALRESTTPLGAGTAARPLPAPMPLLLPPTAPMTGPREEPPERNAAEEAAARASGPAQLVPRSTLLHRLSTPLRLSKKTAPVRRCAWTT